jgi:WD40 repeat protein
MDYNTTTGVYAMRLWDTAGGQLRATLTLTDPIFSFTFSPDSRALETSSYSSTANFWSTELWDVASGRLKTTLPAVHDPVSARFAFSPDSQTLATGSYDAAAHLYPVQLWDAASGRLKVTLQADPDGTDGFAFSPDSQTLETSSYNWTTNVRTVRLWDVSSGQLKAIPSLAAADRAAFDFSPDSHTLVAESIYNSTTGLFDAVQLWDVASGQLRATLKGEVMQFAFSADGHTLATRDGSGRLHLWDITSASPILITAQTSLAQLPAWLTHPFFTDGPTVSLLDPVDEHVLATLQTLPDAPASLYAPPPDPAAPPTGGNWISTTPDSYFEGSANLAPFIRWNVDGVLYPAAAYWDLYYRPDLVQQALWIPGG